MIKIKEFRKDQTGRLNSSYLIVARNYHLSTALPYLLRTLISEKKEKIKELLEKLDTLDSLQSTEKDYGKKMDLLRSKINKLEKESNEIKDIQKAMKVFVYELEEIRDE